MRPEEWRAGVAGEQGAAEAMRALERKARGGETPTAAAPEGVAAWATAGWRKTGDEYGIAGGGELAADARRVQQCAMFIGQAYSEACERAKAAALEAGGEMQTTARRRQQRQSWAGRPRLSSRRCGTGGDVENRSSR